MTKYSSFSQQQLITENWRNFLVEQQPIAPEQGTTKGLQAYVAGNLRSIDTYEDLNALIKDIIENKKGSGAAQIIKDLAFDAITFGTKPAYDLFKHLGRLPDNKKTNTFLDKLNIDDDFSKIVDDTIENQFLNVISDAFASRTGPLPNDFNINKELQTYIKDRFNKRTVATMNESIYLGAHLDDGTLVCEACLEELLESQRNIIQEAKYQGRTVTLNKPTKGDVKKFKVYVKDPSTGNVKKVNFGDPNMKIKKNIPARRKSFRARHNCDNPGPKTKARYWSCKKW